MAPFLRASLHGLRSTLWAQRERCLLKLPESKYVMCRWYSETAVLEDSTPAFNDTNGEIGASSKGSDSLTTVEDMGKQEITIETTTVSTKQENVSEESATDKLTSLILGKMRSKNSSSSASPAQMGPASSKTSKLPEESNEPAQGDKWDQVMESMRNMAAKRKELLASGGAKPTPSLKLDNSEDSDDFADLDLPSGDLSKALSNADNLPSTDDAFKRFISGSKQREGTFQAKKAKAVSFSFLKALDNSDTASSRAQSTGSQNSFNRIAGKPKDSGLQGLMQPPRKEAKPLSFDFLKAPETKGAPPPGVQAKTTDTPRSFSFIDKRESSTHPGTASVSAHPGPASVTARTVSIDDIKRESSNTTSSCYIVCVQSLPVQSNLALVKEALSIHGQVISSYKTPNADGSCNAFFEYKTAEAMDDALASRWLQMDSKVFGIVRADSPITTVVRVSRVSANTTDSQLQAMCEKFGSIDNIRKRGVDVYDVFYKTGELSNMSAILDRLNEVTLNQRRWVALPAPLLHPGVKREALKSSEGQAWHAHQLSKTLSRIEMGLEAVAIHFEDLKSLVAMEDEILK